MHLISGDEYELSAHEKRKITNTVTMSIVNGTVIQRVTPFDSAKPVMILIINDIMCMTADYGFGSEKIGYCSADKIICVSVSSVFGDYEVVQIFIYAHILYFTQNPMRLS